jgi:hypothetical protein
MGTGSRQYALAFAAAVLSAVAAVSVATPEDRGVLADLDRCPTIETHRIRVTNATGGEVQISPDEGANWLTVGTVVRPARELILGYAATRWSRDGTVCATAVHGFRIRVARASDDGRGSLIALVPKEFESPPPNYGGFDPQGAGIYTNIPAGTAIFRNLAPYVGNPAYVQVGDELKPLPSHYQPLVGDRLVIVVRRPDVALRGFVFENHVGGSAYAEAPDGGRRLLGRVERAVVGVGRFDATGYTGVGCINTNHSGVITISTAPDHNGEPLFDDPFGETRGGFMVQPSKHAANELKPYEQVLVVGPATAADPPLEGRPPLFSGFIGLQFQSRDLSRSYVCLMQVDHGPWEPVPEYIGRNDRLFTPEGLTAYYAGRGAPRQIREGATAFFIRFPTALGGGPAAGAAASAGDGSDVCLFHTEVLSSAGGELPRADGV